MKMTENDGIIEIESASPEDTAKIGEILGRCCKASDVLCLNGDLGTGKTALAGGIAKGLDIGEYITSPTFTIVHEYTGRLQMFHFDVYRIGDADEMFDIGFDEYLSAEGVTLVEWAELITPALPDEMLDITIEKQLEKDVDARLIRMRPVGSGARYVELCADLKAILAK